jgi:hypothetical protein
MSNNLQDALATHVADMLAVENHVLQALERQEKDDDAQANAQGLALIRRSRTQLAAHVDRLDAYRDQLDAGFLDKAKETLTTALGTLAGLYDKIRPHTLTRMLRDDYTALSLVAVSATLLHTTALSFRNQAVAQLALDILKDTKKLIVDISELIPEVVVQELADKHDESIDRTAAATAVSNTQAVWSPTRTASPSATTATRATVN